MVSLFWFPYDKLHYLGRLHGGNRGLGRDIQLDRRGHLLIGHGSYQARQFIFASQGSTASSPSSLSLPGTILIFLPDGCVRKTGL